MQTKMMRADIADSAYDLQDSCTRQGRCGRIAVAGDGPHFCGTVLSVATSGSVVAAVRKVGAFCEGFGFSIRLAIWPF